jgi:hypothetical protein
VQERRASNINLVITPESQWGYYRTFRKKAVKANAKPEER